MLNILIVGCGDIGVRCAGGLRDQGYSVTAVRRNISVLPDWLEAHSADVTNPSSLTCISENHFDVVIYILAAAAFNAADYRAAYITGVENTLAALEGSRQSLKRFIFVSSTGVYHQNNGETVDENSSTEPATFNGQLVLEGEQLVRANAFGTCVRFSGIYGPDRLRMINRVAAGQGSGIKSTAFSNRIHVEDCAGVLLHLVNQVAADQDLFDVYLASDSLPATTSEVESFIAERLGLTLAQSGPAEQSRRIAGSKRCDNRRLLESSYEFIYPDYRAGYQAIIDGLRNSRSGGIV